MNGQPFHNQNTYRHGKAAALGLLLSLLFWGVACEKEVATDGMEEDQMAELIITLTGMDNAVPVTRASEEEEFPYERKIEECWVVLFDSDDKWVMTVATDKFTINNNSIDSRSETTVKVPAGDYTGYAFANLDNLDNGDELTAALEKGKQLGGTDLTKDYLNSLAVSLGTDASVFKATDGGKAIPMSSYAKENITVQKNAYNKAEIGMFRMLGKVTITVTNQLGNSNTLSLKSLSMGNFRKGNILFIPYKEGEITLDDMLGTPAQQLSPTFPSGASSESYEQTVVSSTDNVSIVNGEQRPFSFYAFETGPETNQQTNGDMQVKIQVNDRALSTKGTDFSFMRRNDWLKIPILVSDIETVLGFENMRMPIGGLPYQVKYGEPDGIQILVDAVNEVDPDYAGPVKVSFQLKSISGATGALNIIYPPSGSETGTKPWSEAKLTDNADNLLINKETGMPISVTTGNEPGITLTRGEPGTDGNITSGSFEVWTQELGKDSDATIRLTLVVEYGEPSSRTRMEIPYTIRIQNYKKSSSSTGEGGN